MSYTPPASSSHLLCNVVAVTFVPSVLHNDFQILCFKASAHIVPVPTQLTLPSSLSVSSQLFIFPSSSLTQWWFLSAWVPVPVTNLLCSAQSSVGIFNRTGTWKTVYFSCCYCTGEYLKNPVTVIKLCVLHTIPQFIKESPRLLFFSNLVQ